MSDRHHQALVTADGVHAFIDDLFGADLHAKRLQSMSDATLGIAHAGSLGIHTIGRGLAAVKGLTDKHAIKQVDRCIGNEKIDVDLLTTLWTRQWCEGREELIVNLDWTEFDADDQSMLVASLQTDHGRSLPLMWKTVVKSALKGARNDHEDDLLVRLRAAIPQELKVVIVADRGFGDQKLFGFLSNDLGFDYIIRIRSCIKVTNAKGEQRTAGEWAGKAGRLRTLKNPAVTAAQTRVGAVVVVHEKRMDETWCLVASDPTWSGALIKRCYGKRFTCEETFRDIKDLRFGFGMSWNRVSTTSRRDRMMLLATLAQALLTLLGAAGEAAGLDRLLKVNTSRRRTMSLLRQGIRWYELIPRMPQQHLVPLITKFTELLVESSVFRALITVEEE